MRDALRSSLPPYLRRPLGRARRAFQFLLKRRRFRVRIAGSHYKLLFPSQAGSVQSEEIAKEVTQSPPWNVFHYIFPATRALPFGFIFQSTEHLPSREISLNEAVEFCNKLLMNIPSGCDQRAALHLIHPKVRLLLEQHQDRPECEWLIRCLAGFQLPVTGCHADLHQPNILKLNSGFAIIDFETFRTEGSCVEDCIRLVATMERKRKRPDNKAKNDILALFESTALQGINFKLERLQWSAVYITSQAGCEFNSKSPDAVLLNLIERTKVAHGLS